MIEPNSLQSRLFCFVVAVVGLVSWLVAMPASAAQTYTAVRLGTLGGGTIGFGINASGQVTGLSYPSSGPYHAFLYSGGTMQDLGTLDGTASLGRNIDASGRVVGYSGHAFLYSGGTMTDLGTLGGATSSAEGINVAGQIVGQADTLGNAATHAFLYSGGAMTDIGTLGGTSSGAAAINFGGQITGGADTAGNVARRAFLFSGGVMTDLGTLGGLNSQGNAINASGQVTGRADIAGGAAYHAFLYSGGTIQDLGALGGPYSGGLGINANGEVVGFSGTPADMRAFLYSGGTMYDLNALVVSGLGGAKLVQATAINDRGQIVANTCSIVPSCIAFRLDPVAVPATVTAVPMLSREALAALVLMFLASGLLLRRRSNR